ncbi:MAG: methionine--tRNA ligase, partial [Alphaproteobacteria bacterium]|nr:methionine--tRNA ligase [Alphaproteobacteria bacterium]
VWLDALTNYITALGYPDTEASDFATFWPEAHHIVGKDILRFHAIFWPAFLMAADLPLPKRVYAHGWWTNEGQKCSKSLGNVLDPFELIKTYGVDQLRYFMMREIPFGQDGDFSCDSMERRINSDLANDYGNLIQRVLSFVAKHAGGVVPKKGTLTRDDEAMLKEVQSLYDDLKPLLAEEQAFHKYLERLWRAIGVANRYVDTQAPWALRKTDTDRMETVLYVLSEAIRYITILAQPFLPDATEKILDQLAVPKNKRTFANLSAESALVSGTALPNPEPIFPRYVPGGSHEKTLAR